MSKQRHHAPDDRAVNVLVLTDDTFASGEALERLDAITDVDQADIDEANRRDRAFFAAQPGERACLRAPVGAEWRALTPPGMSCELVRVEQAKPGTRMRFPFFALIEVQH